MKRSKTAPETVGERLKKARERVGLSVEEVAKRTKMHARIVAALEEDQAVERLSPVYVRSFLRMYARLVGLNEQALLQDFTHQYPAPSDEEAAAPQPTPAPIVPVTPDKETMPAAHWPAWTWRPAREHVMVAGAVALAVLGAWGLLAAWQHHPIKRRPSSPTATKSAPTSLFRFGRAKPSASQKSIAFSASTLPAVAIPAQESLRLQVMAKERVWLRVTADGRTIFQNVLEKGKSEQWMANERFDLWLGSAGSVALTLNGKVLGSPGKRGEVIRDLVVTHHGMQVSR